MVIKGGRLAVGPWLQIGPSNTVVASLTREDVVGLLFAEADLNRDKMIDLSELSRFVNDYCEWSSDEDDEHGRIVTAEATAAQDKRGGSESQIAAQFAANQTTVYVYGNSPGWSQDGDEYDYSDSERASVGASSLGSSVAASSFSIRSDEDDSGAHSSTTNGASWYIFP